MDSNFRFGAFGLYVAMFVEIIKTLTKSSFIFVILLTGFAGAFAVLFQIPIEKETDVSILIHNMYTYMVTGISLI